jgi:biopolymer transport protein TolQ
MMIDFSQAVQFPLADIIFSFRQSHLPGKVIVFLLFVGSIYAWSIMVTKFMEMRRAREATAGFLFVFRKESNPVTVFLRRQKFPDSPLYAVYEKCCVTLGAELEALGLNSDDLFVADFSADTQTLSSHQYEAMRNVTERNVADQSLMLERRMSILATAVMAAPFLGLLGTVWGVMEAFTGMAIIGTATLSAVAPGIAAALLTTVMGLLVALPSVIGYNLLTGQIAELQVQTSNFAKEYMDKVGTMFLRAA